MEILSLVKESKILGFDAITILHIMTVVRGPDTSEIPVDCKCPYCKAGRYYKLKEKIMKGKIRIPKIEEFRRTW